MSAGKLASVAALTGGMSWLVKVGLVAADRAEGGAVAWAVHVVGVVCLVVALLGFGYSLVATAPAWLRLVVSVATATLGVMLFLTVQDAATGLSDGAGWPAHELGTLLAAVVATLVGLAGLLHARNVARGVEAAAHPSARGAHAAR